MGRFLRILVAVGLYLILFIQEKSTAYTRSTKTSNSKQINLVNHGSILGTKRVAVLWASDRKNSDDRDQLKRSNSAFGQEVDTDWNQQQLQRQQLLPDTAFGAEGVPESQRPVNEYLDMMKQPLFGWASEDGSRGLLVRLGWVYLLVLVAVGYPIAGATYTQEGFVLPKLLAAHLGTLSLIGFLLVRLYSGWDYVGARLMSKVIEFEETGWYDGKFEKKSDAELKRDKFLYLDKVKPVIDRLKLFGSAFVALWVGSVIGYNVATSYQPLYDNYDPKMLERLNYDDELAEKAASRSGSRPTYCDNRYYRAVANGGQGCDA